MTPTDAKVLYPGIICPSFIFVLGLSRSFGFGRTKTLYPPPPYSMSSASALLRRSLELPRGVRMGSIGWLRGSLWVSRQGFPLDKHFRTLHAFQTLPTESILSSGRPGRNLVVEESTDMGACLSLALASQASQASDTQILLHCIVIETALQPPLAIESHKVVSYHHFPSFLISLFPTSIDNGAAKWRQ